MLKWIVQNKYKLMAFIIVLYLFVDVLKHKGQTRVLFPKSFPVYKMDSLQALGSNGFLNKGKHWKKGINTREQLYQLAETITGFEVDVYFDMGKQIFDVHHDADKNIGLSLDDLLKIYRTKKMSAGIWLDIKNLDEKNSAAVLGSLIRLRNEFGLQTKLIVESPRAELLSAFTDSLFFTSFYVPMFNPYQLNDDETKLWADRIAAILKTSRINALSGYYFQYAFLHHYFPGYPILTWGDKDPISFVNWLFRKKMETEEAVLISLYP